MIRYVAQWVLRRRRVEGERGWRFRKDGIRDKAYKSRVTSSSFIFFYLRRGGKGRAGAGVERISGGEGRKV